jgi:hypothetical protein
VTSAEASTSSAVAPEHPSETATSVGYDDVFVDLDDIDEDNDQEFDGYEEEGSDEYEEDESDVEYGWYY